MKCTSKILFPLLLMLIAISCSDGGDPKLMILLPKDSSIFQPGDIIHVEGTAIDDKGIITIRILSHNLDVDHTLTDFTNPAVVAFAYTIELDPQLQPGDYTLTITATDEDTNRAEEEVAIVIEE